MRIIHFTACLIFSASVSFASEIDVDAIENPVTVDSASITKGAKLYQKHCVVCHGEKMDGNGPSAESFEVAPWGFIDGELKEISDGYLFQQIKNGGPWFEMPPFVLALKDEQIWNLVNYLKSLGK